MPNWKKNNANRNNRPKNNGQWITKSELNARCVRCPKDIFSIVQPYVGVHDLTTIRASYDANQTSTAGGLLQTVLAADPTQLSLWTQFNALYDEFRVLAHKVTFSPVKYNGSVISQAPILTVIDRDSSAVITSYTVGCESASNLEFSGGEPWSRTVFMDGIEDAGFMNTATFASASSPWWIKIYSSGNTATTDMGHIKVDLIIQFRGTD
jgi:hypothetical protein